MGERYGGISALVGLAVLGALSDTALPRKDRACRYREAAGPPHPTTRQQRRALQRKATAALARLTPQSTGGR